MADHLIDMLGLPQPNSQTCIMWDEYAWIDTMKVKIPYWRRRRDTIYLELLARSFGVDGDAKRGPFPSPVCEIRGKRAGGGERVPRGYDKADREASGFYRSGQGV